MNHRYLAVKTYQHPFNQGVVIEKLHSNVYRLVGGHGQYHMPKRVLKEHFKHIPMELAYERETVSRDKIGTGNST